MNMELTFSERKKLSRAYQQWLDEKNELSKAKYKISDCPLSLVNFLAIKGFLNAGEIKSYLESKESKQ